MAQVKIEKLIDYLDNEFKGALEDTFQHFAPSTRTGRDEIFRFFLNRVYHRCNIWERIPDDVVKQSD
jgi:hypothetical protein